jgi:hypothetical protein
MRTTVTLDGDVERLLHEAMHAKRRTFKETLNDALRTALGTRPAPAARRFKVRARPMGLRPGIDPARLNQLLDDVDVDAAGDVMRSHERS